MVRTSFRKCPQNLVTNSMTRSRNRDRKFFVYCLFRPSGAPCYIGKGSGGRLQTSAAGQGSTNPRLQKIIERHGGPLPAVVIRNGLTEPEAFATEMALISAIGRNKRGPLVNMTDGGEGISGHRHGQKTRDLMSRKAAVWNAARTPEHRRAIGQSSWIRLTPEQRSARARQAVAGLSKEELKRLGDRINAGLSFEERSARLKAAFGKIEPEKLSARSRNGGLAIAKLLTPEEQRRRYAKGMAKNVAAKINRIWINNGVKTKQLKPNLPIPNGWVRGRLPYTRNIDHEKASAGALKSWETRRAKAKAGTPHQLQLL